MSVTRERECESAVGMMRWNRRAKWREKTLPFSSLRPRPSADHTSHTFHLSSERDLAAPSPPLPHPNLLDLDRPRAYTPPWLGGCLDFYMFFSRAVEREPRDEVVGSSSVVVSSGDVASRCDDDASCLLFLSSFACWPAASHTSRTHVLHCAVYLSVYSPPRSISLRYQPVLSLVVCLRYAPSEANQRCAIGVGRRGARGVSRGLGAHRRSRRERHLVVALDRWHCVHLHAPGWYETIDCASVPRPRYVARSLARSLDLSRSLSISLDLSS